MASLQTRVCYIKALNIVREDGDIIASVRAPFANATEHHAATWYTELSDIVACVKEPDVVLWGCQGTLSFCELQHT